MLQQAEVIDTRELGQQALVELQKAQERYDRVRGWFGACEGECVQAKDKFDMARDQVARVKQHRDTVLSEARREVGIWSSFGVQDVRASFWAAWKEGKDFAARLTMYDVLFMAGGRDETLYTMLFKLLFRYIINLTIGLIGAFISFMYTLYGLIVSYGSSFISGLAFFLLAAVSGLSLIATYLGAITGTVVGGGVFLMQQAEGKAALEAGSRRKKPSQQLTSTHACEKDIV